MIAANPWKNAVRAKTAAALAANTYANGTSGAGATLTGNSNGALAAVDGVTLTANARMLVDQEALASHNGIYIVTQLGDASHPYILTRATDADSGAKLVNATVKISEGTTFADQEWQCTTNATITVGTTSLTWAQAGGGLAIQDEGSAQGAAGTINFTGLGVSVSVSGGVASVNIPGGGAGGAGWTQVGAWDFATNGAVATVDSSSLASYNEVLVEASGVTRSVAGQHQLQVSTDSGATYYGTSGNYLFIDGNGAVTNQTGFTTINTTLVSARSWVAKILNLKGPRKLAQMVNQISFPAWSFVAATQDITNVRVTATTAGNFTGGSIRIYAR